MSLQETQKPGADFFKRTDAGRGKKESEPIQPESAFLGATERFRVKSDVEGEGVEERGCFQRTSLYLYGPGKEILGERTQDIKKELETGGIKRAAELKRG